MILPEVEEEVNPLRTKGPTARVDHQRPEGLGVIVLDGISAPEIVE